MSSTALTLSAFLSLAAACAPDVAPETLAGIARHESGFNPYAVGINSGARLTSDQQPRTKPEAVAFARRLMAEGRDFDAGLGQINVRNWGWLGLTVETVFDPCVNVAASAAVLTAYSRYNTGHAQRGFGNGYVARVLAAQQANAAAPATDPAPAAPTPQAAPEPPAPPRLMLSYGRTEPGRILTYGRRQ